MKLMKKILMVGEWGEGALAHSFARTLNGFGYHVIQFDVKQYTRSNSASGFSGLHTLRTMIDHARINQAFKKMVTREHPDQIFLIKGDVITERSLLFAKKTGALLINFYPDNPFVFWNGNSNEQVLKSLPFYDYFLMWSRMLVPAIESAGCRRVVYMPFAYDETQFPESIVMTESEMQEYASDVCFVGSWDLDREQWLQGLITHMPSVRLAVWGNGWLEQLSEHSKLRAYIRGSAVYGLSMMKIFRASKIVLNFIRRQNMTSHNMRTIEVPASGAFLLTQRTIEQAELLFKEHVELTCFNTVDELVQKISYYLAHDQEREAIAVRGRQRATAYRLSVWLDYVMRLITGAPGIDQRSTEQLLLEPSWMGSLTTGASQEKSLFMERLQPEQALAEPLPTNPSNRESSMTESVQGEQMKDVFHDVQ